MSDTEPFVSVIICTRDRNEMVQRCLNSVLQQNYSRYEVLLIDNASRSFRIPEINSCRVPVRIYSYPIPGLSAARNSALPFAGGDILAFLDDDAVATADWLNHGQKTFQDARTGCVTGKILPLSIESVWQQRLSTTGWFPSDDSRREFDGVNYDPVRTSAGTGSNFFILKNCFETTRFPEEFGPGTPVFAADEHYFFYSIIQNGWKIIYDPESIVYHEYVSSREEYEAVLKKYAISRNAYLIKFLFAEPGYRLHTWKYVAQKLLGHEKQSSTQSSGASSGWNLFSGASAFLKSIFRKRVRAELKLLREFSTDGVV